MESPFDDRNTASADSLALFNGLKQSMAQTRITSFDLGEPALALSHPCRIVPKQLNRLPKMRAPLPTDAFDTENRMAQRDALSADFSNFAKEKEVAKSLKLSLTRSQLSADFAGKSLEAWKKRDEYASAPKKYTTAVPVPAMKNSGPMWFNETERTYETEGNIIHAVKKDAPPADNVSAEDIKALKLKHQTPQWALSHERDVLWEQSNPKKPEKKIFTHPSHEGCVLPPMTMEEMHASGQLPPEKAAIKPFASFDTLNDSVYNILRREGAKATLDLETI
jgi:hypothetical protein